MSNKVIILFLYLFFFCGLLYSDITLCSESDKKDLEFRSMNGPFGGLCLGMTMDPADPNHLITGNQSAIYHSRNGGITWIPGQTIQAFSPLSHFRRDPSNPDIILATGSDSVLDERCDIYQSVDSGQTWTALNMTDSFHDIWIHEIDTDRYIVGGDSGILLSEDAGETWTFRNISAEVYEFASHPDDPDKIYAVIEESGLAVSEDGGYYWTIKNPEDRDSDCGRTTNGRSIAVAPDGTHEIFSAYRFNHAGYIARSIDDGETWETVLEAPINCVRFDPNDSNVLWATGGKYDWDPIEVYRSGDRGNSWQSIDVPFKGMGWYIYIDPSDSAVMFITKVLDGIITTVDGSATWNLANRYLSGTWVSSITLNPVDETSLIAGCRDSETMFFTDKWGRQWNRIEGVDSAFSSAAAYKPDDVDTILAGCRAISESTDGGTTFSYTNSGGPARIQRIRYCTGEPDYVYAGKVEYSDSNGVYLSQNGGNYWSRVSTHNVATLEVDPFNPAIAFVHAYMGPNNSFLRSDDYGLNWTDLPVIAWGVIVADPLVPGRFYIQEQPQGIARTEDWGETWITGLGSEITETLLDMVVSPIDGSIYAAGEGLWVSADQGQTWNNFIQGLKTETSRRVAIRDEDGIETVYLGTTQSGLYRRTSPDLTGPECRMLTPSGGEVLYHGEDILVEWTASDNEMVMYADLFLSLNSGQTWPIVVAGGLLEDGHFTWSVPMIACTTCRMKVVVYDPSWNQAFDSSTGDFTIVAPTPTPTLTPTHTPPPTPSPTKTPIATETASPTPQSLSIQLIIPAGRITGGEQFYLDAWINNPYEPAPWAPVFIALQIGSDYWLAPGWRHYTEVLDHYIFCLPVGEQIYPIIPPFAWPDLPFYNISAHFIAFITDPQSTGIISNIDTVTFTF